VFEQKAAAAAEKTKCGFFSRSLALHQGDCHVDLHDPLFRLRDGEKSCFFWPAASLGAHCAHSKAKVCVHFAAQFARIIAQRGGFSTVVRRAAKTPSV
jgi:hypothetical protein